MFSDLVFHCGEVINRSTQQGGASFSGTLAVVNPADGTFGNPAMGYPVQASLAYNSNGDLPVPALEPGKFYQVTFTEVPAPTPPAQ